MPLRRRPLVCLLALGACASDAPTATRVRIAALEPLRSFEIGSVVSFGDGNAIRLVHVGLTRASVSAPLAPGLARHWSSTDGRRWRFDLRTDLRFASGTRATSHDVVRAWSAMLRLPRGTPARLPIFDEIIGADDVAAGRTLVPAGLRIVDDSTLDVALRSAQHAFAAIVSRPEFVVPGPADSAGRPDGLGPFVLASGRPGDSVMVFVQRAAHAFDRQPLDTLELVTVSGDRLAAALAARRIDCAPFVMPGAETAVRLLPDVRITRTPPAIFARLMLNPRTAILRDVRVRQALLLALDQRRLPEGGTDGATGVIAATRRVPAGLLGPASWQPAATYAPDSARRLLQAAGYAGQTIRLGLLAGRRDTLDDPIRRIRTFWEAVGLRVELVQLKSSLLSIGRDEADAAPNYVFQVFPDATEFLGRLYEPGSTVTTMETLLPDRATLERLLTEARASTDSARTALLVDSLEAVLAAAAPDVPLWHQPLLSAGRLDGPGCTVGLGADTLMRLRP